jgi:spore coat polysaccharide biosynthesis protein SpsF
VRTIAIIQARLASIRLPLKIVAPLLGRPMLEHISERVRRAKKLDGVILAMPPTQEDRTVGKKVGDRAYYWQIPEDDLIARFFQTARAERADYVVRICADNPCIDPAAIDLLIDYALAKQPKGVLFTNAGDLPGSQWPDGIGAEFYSMKMLEWMNATIKSAELREHPHKYWHTMGYVEEPPPPVEWYPAGLKLDVNTTEDYLRIKAIYDHFQNNTFNISDICQYLDEQKDLEKRRVFT